MAHWFRTNDASRYPRRIICLDSEARIKRNETEDQHTFRCAVAAYMRFGNGGFQLEDDDCCYAETPNELWNFVTGYTRSRERTVVFAHNVAYDLRLTRALELLPEHGFEPVSVAIDARRCWARFRKGDASLYCVDLQSFFPCSLAKIGETLGIQKLGLPQDEDPEEDWIARCIRDVEITRSAVLRLFTTLDRLDAGNFRLTGAAQGMSLFRHRFLKPKTLLVHAEEEVIELERRAAWTGRCEIWRHGVQDGYVFEWDYTLAYAHLARDNDVPAKLIGEMTNMNTARLAAYAGTNAILLDVEVNTNEPVVPCELDGHIIWPTGRFRTSLWEPEFRLLYEVGANVRVERAFAYRRSPILREWGEWIISALAGDDGSDQALAQILLKGWARSTIGRFAMRYPKWENDGTENENDLRLDSFIDIDTNVRGAYLHIGNSVMVQSGDEESPSSCPQVTSYIMSLARARLWKAMVYAGLENVLYLDTDSLVVNAKGHTRLRLLAEAKEHEGLRFVARHKGALLQAPRHIELGGERKIAGLPKNATKVDSDLYMAETWQGVTQALREGNGNRVVVRRSLHHVPPIDRRRVHLEGGGTVAHEIKAE